MVFLRTLWVRPLHPQDDAIPAEARCCQAGKMGLLLRRANTEIGLQGRAVCVRVCGAGRAGPVCVLSSAEWAGDSAVGHSGNQSQLMGTCR